MRVLALATLVASTACIPLNISSECRATISDCERNCAPHPPASTMNYVPPDNDTRSACQKSCESLCTN